MAGGKGVVLLVKWQVSQVWLVTTLLSKWHGSDCNQGLRMASGNGLVLLVKGRSVKCGL